MGGNNTPVLFINIFLLNLSVSWNILKNSLLFSGYSYGLILYLFEQGTSLNSKVSLFALVKLFFWVNISWKYFLDSSEDNIGKLEKLSNIKFSKNLSIGKNINEDIS